MKIERGIYPCKNFNKHKKVIFSFINSWQQVQRWGFVYFQLHQLSGTVENLSTEGWGRIRNCTIQNSDRLGNFTVEAKDTDEYSAPRISPSHFCSVMAGDTHRGTSTGEKKGETHYTQIYIPLVRRVWRSQLLS